MITKMRLLDQEKRKNSFEEVSLGYNQEEALKEANRCLNCKNAKCIDGCPVNINIPLFINKIKTNEINDAFNIITEQNSFPGICGRVCPQEKQCEKNCVFAKKNQSIAIGRLERFVYDFAFKTPIEVKSNSNLSIGVIGSGPAGLACSSVSRSFGSNVVVYEAMHLLGGVLTYGIPEFRLPKKVVNDEINRLKESGVVFKTNYVIGLTKTLEQLLEIHDYLFIATGAGTPRFMNIKGEDAIGVYSANEFLTRVNLMKANNASFDTPLPKMKNVVVVGGGNVSMDACRVAKRLGCNVSIVYRRNKLAMPARSEEIEHALEEGINLYELTNPYEIIKNEDHTIKKVLCHKMLLDESGLKTLDETVEIECDTFILAIGNKPNPILKNSTDLIDFLDNGLIKVDANYQTSHKRIFAGGDITTGAATVILAMEAGKKVALNIHKGVKHE